MPKRYLSFLLLAPFLFSACGSNTTPAPETETLKSNLLHTQQYCPTNDSNEKSYTGELYAPEITIHDFLPHENGFTFTYSGGILCAEMTGSGPADMDLELYKRIGNRWKRVTYSANTGNNEHIVYHADRGTYRWAVTAWTSSGKYFVTTRE